MKISLLRLLNGMVLATGGLAGTLAAQSAPVISQPVVQPLPNPGAARLNAALARLGRDPRDAGALLDAGDAARELGDFEAAAGFYRRAEEILPGDPRVKVGQARALVMNGDPVTAIALFDAAEKAGASAAEIAADRGLAYDLVGDNRTAQRYYALAMAGARASDEVRMRLALSQAMAGDQQTAEQTLLPLLQQQDKPGWRTRAFALAIGGDTRQAVDVAERILPPQLAENIAPYLRYMPRLTKAQQAAAANLGRFPRASEIGRDDPRIAAYAPPRPVAVDAALVPAGEPLDSGRKGKATRVARTEKPSSATSRTRGGKVQSAASAGTPVAAPVADPARVVPPEPKPAIARNGELPPVARTAVPAASPPPAASLPVKPPAPSAAQPPVPPAAKPAASVATVPAAAVARPVPAPGFDLSRLPASSATPAPVPASAATPPPATTAPAAGDAEPSFAAMFADFGKPATHAAPVAGAVDIRQIDPARPEPKAEPKVEEKPKPKKPAPPAHPSRIWVQIGVGRDKGAIAFDWRRYTRQAPAVFKGMQPHVSQMGRTNRILAGPFATQKAANEFIADLGKAGMDGALPWTSPAGQVVDTLAVK